MSYQTYLEKVKAASRTLNSIDPTQIDAFLNMLADNTLHASQTILAQNKRDLERMDSDDPRYDRLLLTPERIEGIAGDIRKLAGMPSPLYRELLNRRMDSGLLIQKISVPLGVVGIIYEARPNVTLDVSALCLKSGNACVLKGGSDAMYSNKAIVELIRQTCEQSNINPDVVQLLPPEREAATALLNAVGYVDIVIPRGSQGLIDYVRDNARVPVIETGAGIVHTYYDKEANKNKGMRVIHNAKTRRVSVCNALDCLVIHKERLQDLPDIMALMIEDKVEVFADQPACEVLNGNYPEELLNPAQEKHFGLEFLSYRMAVKTVSNIDEALDHVARYSSMHSEAIITENPETAERYLRETDAAAVYHNASTAFTDGAQFGLGAEIGISTQKLHARGPMALEELTSYKWIVKGDGTVRPK